MEIEIDKTRRNKQLKGQLAEDRRRMNITKTQKPKEKPKKGCYNHLSPFDNQLFINKDKCKHGL